MSNGSGVSRGDRNRNARLSRLRSAVPVSNAIVGIDLADRKQMVVVTDHDSKVLARRTFRVKAWDLGAALDWAAERAAKAGFAGVTVACEPTGHRWRVLGQLAEQRGMSFVCVQPAISAWVRKTEDLTSDKTDDKDAVLIARLVAQLRCYLPEPVDETWGRLRHLGTRREQLIEEHVRCVQQIRDLLECVWPAALEAAKHPFKSTTWVAAMAVVMGRDGGDLERTRRLGRGPVRTRRPQGGDPPRRATSLPADRAPPVHRPDRPGRGAGAPAGRVRADRLGHRRLGPRQDRPGRHRDPDDRRPGRAGADRARHQHRRAVRGRGRGDPGRDRRPEQVHQRPGRGQTRRPRPRESASPAPSPAAPASPAPAARCCAPPPGGPCGAAYKPTGCTPPATGT